LAFMAEYLVQCTPLKPFRQAAIGRNKSFLFFIQKSFFTDDASIKKRQSHLNLKKVSNLIAKTHEKILKSGLWGESYDICH